MKCGFATVLVLIMSAALTTTVLTLWHNVSNSVDITIEHECATRLAGYAECVISYGIAIVQKHFDLVHRELGNQALSFDMNDAMVQLGATAGSARLALSKPTIMYNNLTCIVLNGIVEQGDYRCHIRCLVMKNKKDGQCSVDGYTFVTSL